jgi:GNAT superfamily N-acetyltransferase
MTARTEVDIRPSTIGECRAAGLDDLLISHWSEVETNTDEIPLDFNWPLYLHNERVGMYRALGAWRGPKLVGYNAFFVQPTLHHQQTVHAFNDGIFLDPSERKGLLGARLVKTAEPWLRELGVRLIVYETKEAPHFGHGKARGTLSRLLENLGYPERARLHEKLL